MTDSRIGNFAKILVEHSANIQPGDRIAIESTTAALPLIEEVFTHVLRRGGHPLLLLALPDQDEIMYKNANDEQLSHIHDFQKLAYETFDSRIRIHSSTNTRALSNVDAPRQGVRQKALSPILETQMHRGAAKEFKWVTTLFPTQAYAMEANMGLQEYEDFVYSACHADNATDDPIGYWNGTKKTQESIVQAIQGHDKVVVKGPNVDLSLSIKDRTFINSHGRHNMPDGEIYTGPVENSLNGWVRYTFPAIIQGRVVEGVELQFKDGKVVEAKSRTNQDFLYQMLNTDPGASYVGEFAIGTNFQITQFTGNILFDEKIGGTFHMALGAGYPETGSLNKSMIHWDMICDLRTDSEILVDGDVIYRNGEFVIE